MYTVDQFTTNSCNVCCCEDVGVKPGTSIKLTINYAPWAVPIGRLHCLPSFSLEQMETCSPNSGQPNVIEPVRFATPINTDLVDDLKTVATEPDVTFKRTPLYGPWHGTVVINLDGTFTYTPLPGYTGEDRFYVTASFPNTKSTTFEVMVGVGIDETKIKPTPHVWVDEASVHLNERQYIASFALRVSPAADMCEVWRLSVMQNAIDCDCSCYNRIDCFDIRMVKC